MFMYIIIKTHFICWGIYCQYSSSLLLYYRYYGGYITRVFS